ncbi:MAG: radical SAM protein [Desulfobacteraceae bacterium]|nr:radical SAM protein [Desulfobacteraceae bacterium]
MKLLMVQVPTSHLGSGEKVYPLGLSRLSSLVPDNVEKHALDMNICIDPWAQLKESLENQAPDIVTLSFRNLDPLAGHQASYLSSLKTAAQLVRNIVPKTRIMAGGPAFSLFAKRLMIEIPQIDIGLVGEGELFFNQLLSSILHLEPLSVEPISVEHIPGIIRRDNDRLITNSMGPKISMDDIPKMDVKTFCPNDYSKANTYVAAMGIEGKRGCDLWCGYCLYPFLGGTCMRLRSPKKIVDEIQMLKNEYGIQLFHFTDSVVNRPSDHFEDLCRELIHRKLDIAWTGFFREDSLTRQNLSMAMNAGLTAIYFSGDALTDQGLKLLNKQLCCEDILNASTLTAEMGILTMCHFLVNLPYETKQTIDESSKMLDRILDIHGPVGNLGAIIFNNIRLYPDTPLTRKLTRSGILEPRTDFLYPVYHNPEKFRHILHEFEARCHSAGVFSRLNISNGINNPYKEGI